MLNPHSPIVLMTRRFLRHKVAVISLILLLVFYLGSIFAPFIAPYNTESINTDMLYTPPAKVGLDWNGLFVYQYEHTIDKETFKNIYVVDKSQKIRLKLFQTGQEYKFFGKKMSLHLIQPEGDYPFFLFGSDGMGRDLLSRILYGSRISLTVGLIGIAISLVLGLIIGGISGFIGGFLDSVVQRVIEAIISIPTIPLWMSLSVILPYNWSPLKIYFGITILLSLVGWTTIARVTRSKFLALRSEDFVSASITFGAGNFWIITKHLIPSFMSYVIVTASLMVPTMILGETGLSFLGLGLRDPVVSWGTLLNGAQKITVIALYPWLMLPGLFVIIVILAYNFVGDGLRDAADPYSDLD
ncbi:MAG: ABC transporter permease [Bacteroidetes bacterium]|nr:ABC transporter permease [Bacteroidota bacterium]